MNSRLIGFVLFTLPLSCLAADFSVEDEGLVALPKQVEEIIGKDASFNDFRNCSIIGKAITLARNGAPSAFIATTANGCAWAAASGPLWVVAPEQNGFHLVLFSYGYSVKIGTLAKNEMRDISISSGTAGWQSDEHWKFNGQQYVKLKNQFEEKR